MTNVLAARELSCRRGHRLVFHDVSFRLTNGEMLQLLGDNGSGKTSLLRICCGLGLAESGSITWNDEPIDSSNECFKRAAIYIGHRAGIAPDLSPLENLQLALDLKRPNRDSISNALAYFDLSNQQHIPCARLSAGQRQRTALAKLMIIDASFWLLDEPFTALDSSTKEKVESLLNAHCERGGLAIIATHQGVNGEDAHLRTLSLAPS